MTLRKYLVPLRGQGAGQRFPGGSADRDVHRDAPETRVTDPPPRDVLCRFVEPGTDRSRTIFAVLAERLACGFGRGAGVTIPGAGVGSAWAGSSCQGNRSSCHAANPSPSTAPIASVAIQLPARARRRGPCCLGGRSGSRDPCCSRPGNSLRQASLGFSRYQSRSSSATL